MVDRAGIIDELAAVPADTALLFDFDGTLAEIVDRPDAAAAVPGAREVLHRLVPHFALVAVVSGRPRRFLESQIGTEVTLAGLYGLETRIAGVVGEHPDADAWRGRVAEAAAAARSQSGWSAAGVTVESKGLSLTVHHRNAPDLATAVAAWAEELAASTGLVPRAAKQSIELHPSIEVDKGTTLVDLVGDVGRVVFAGDDVGDLDAFDALASLRAVGRVVTGIAVGGAELPDAVAAAADHVLAGPAELVAILEAVAARVAD